MAIIYGLFDPREPLFLWEVRYIGQTTKTPSRRLAQHVWTAKRGGESYLLRWIRSLLRDGVRPHVRILEYCDEAILDHREITWIAEGRRQGWKLTNSADGGEGNRGFVASPETRAKQSLARQGFKPTEEHRRNAADATQRARENDPTIYERVSDSLLQFYADHPEEREDISRRNKEWWATHPEARQERGERERAYNLEHPEMIERRNASIQQAKDNQDKSPHYCDHCGGGPFSGPHGLNTHIAKQHNEEFRQPHYCECGAGPFVGERGLNLHKTIKCALRNNTNT